jgi:hypothetical protein
MAIPIQGASVLWEHLTCGNPLYHRYNGREVCALCFPDPQWPEEAMTLLRSIVRGEKEDGEAPAESQILREAEAVASGEAEPFEAILAGWAERDDAYDEALRLLDAFTCNGYEVEVFLERISEWYQVVVRGADGELVCACPEQVEYLIGQAQNGTL